MKNILIISSLILSLNVLGGNLNSNPRPRQEQRRSSCSGPNCQVQPRRPFERVIIIRTDVKPKQKKPSSKFVRPD